MAEVWIHFQPNSHKYIIIIAGGAVGNLHCELGREGQGVPAEAAVCAGQWSGHSVLCSGTNHDEEGIFGGL